MKLQFDPNQQFQLDAVAAVADLFEGQAQGQPQFSVIRLGAGEGLFAGQERSALGIGNQLTIADSTLRDNLRKVQARNEIDVADVAAMPEAWTLNDASHGGARLCPHFSVEMETGTGKTYVYLRTIFELSKRYGFQKFIIVVPSVAVREGVTHSIETTAEHFRALYGNPAFTSFVYSGKDVSRLRQFATGNSLQILVINIDAFRKNFTGTEEEKKSNVIYKEMNQLSGRAPIEFVQAARPIVIIDEPQSVDSTERAQEAIRALNPLCTLRYSATHRNPYNLVYQLGPVRAFELKLVKQIVVASAVSQDAMNEPFVRLEAVDHRKGVKAKLRIHARTADGAKEKLVTATGGSDLFKLSGERPHYANGFEVAEINAEPGNEFIRFANGRILKPGDEIGGSRDGVARVQIRHTIKKHLEKELQVGGRGIKVLSLFFIDRVANYREYAADGTAAPGKFAVVFAEELRDLAKESRFSGLAWLTEPVGKLHNGYFAQDRKGVLKDTRGNTEADDEVYNLIMKNKEALLSVDEPLRFIFSHSALREGWDNPNVFQICTLNETRSTMKKRQEIGRGLRLPVDQSGARVFDDSVNKLYVMANESYEEFAAALQTEYEDDCGVTFGKVTRSAFAKLTRVSGREEVPVGPKVGDSVYRSLVTAGVLDDDGRILPTFNPRNPTFVLALPKAHQDLAAQIVDLLSAYRIERHIQRERDEGENRFRKDVSLSPAFKELWERIKPRTTYRVEFETDDLVRNAVMAIRQMDKVEVPRILVQAGQLEVKRGGVATRATSAVSEVAEGRSRAIPDVLAVLQNETELTRSTIARILAESGRIGEIFNNPQRFLDQVIAILKHELRRLLVDGIKYERLPAAVGNAEWEMVLFKNVELINYLSSEKVKKSVYDYVVYDSEVEREFARQLDDREDIKLFVKLPGWFEIETPIGKYNPDWAIVKESGQAFYLVRETKSTRDFLKLRTSETDKVRCGKAHFDALGVDFATVTNASEVA